MPHYDAMKLALCYCFCHPAERNPGEPFLKTLTVAAATLTCSFKLKHLVAFTVVEGVRGWKKLTLVFPTHTVTIEMTVQASARGLLKGVVEGEYDLIRLRRPEDAESAPLSSERKEGDLKALIVEKLSVRRQQAYEV